jgi:serine/threonine-protein kinase
MSDQLSRAEDDLLALLDQYLSELQSGRIDRDRWRAAHPEVAMRFDCLDRLESLAPVHDPDATMPPPSFNSGLIEVAAEGRFVLLGELGRGGMGVVYKARQVGLERVVALKMVLAGSLASADQLQRFRAEALVAAKVQHPHVVPVFETGQLNGLPYLVMQYIEGCSLAERIKGCPLTPAEAARCVAAVARAVAAMHAVGIVHRDLKPSNILLDAQGRPYVTDFGLAKLLESESGATQTGAVLGTPQYMAPEQALGRNKEVGPSADVYSLGAILFECLTGHPPFREASPFDTVLAVLEREPPRPRNLNPSVPRSLEEVCLQCLDKEPNRRFSSADAFASALEHYVKGEPVPTRHPSLLDRLRRWARREPALASRLAALAATSVIVQLLVMRQPAMRWAGIQSQIIFILWAMISWVCQRALRRQGFADWAAAIWSASDVLLLTAVQFVTGSHVSPLVIGYPFFIAASGLWTRVRLVWITTAFSVLGYAGLVIHERWTTGQPEWLHRHLVFMAALLVLGFVTAYQVQRIRALSRYYEGRD